MCLAAVHSIRYGIILTQAPARWSGAWQSPDQPESLVEILPGVLASISGNKQAGTVLLVGVIQAKRAKMEVVNTTSQKQDYASKYSSLTSWLESGGGQTL